MLTGEMYFRVPNQGEDKGSSGEMGREEKTEGSSGARWP